MGRTARILLAPLIAWTVVAAHGEPERATVTLTGEVVDLVCFVAHGVRGADNRFCAEHAEQVAQPLALLAEDGAVYILSADPENRFGYDHVRTLVGEPAKVEGVASEREGLRVIEVRRASRERR